MQRRGRDRKPTFTYSELDLPPFPPARFAALVAFTGLVDKRFWRNKTGITAALTKLVPFEMQRISIPP